MNKSIAIFSTYKERCGIASYTEAVESYLSKKSKVKVFALQRAVFQSKNKQTQAMADDILKEMFEEAKDYDHVNIQYEPGIVGETANRVYRRMCWMMENHPSVSISFHTMRTEYDKLGNLGRYKKFVPGTIPAAAVGSVFKNWDFYTLHKVLEKISTLQNQGKAISVLFHQHFHARFAVAQYGLNNVFAHPLVFNDKEHCVNAITRSKNRPFMKNLGIKDDKKIVGVYGFIGKYKGTFTAVRALEYLPEDHVLCVFGGLHPRETSMDAESRAYSNSIVEQSSTMIEKEEATKLGKELAAMFGDKSLKLPGKDSESENSLRKRLFFVQDLDDEDFLNAIAETDIPVFPYEEVGQTSSGPICLALEMGKKVLASEIKVFTELAKYRKNKMEFFTPGNYVQLGQYIKKFERLDDETYPEEYNAQTNADTYIAMAAHQKTGIEKKRSLADRRKRVTTPDEYINVPLSFD